MTILAMIRHGNTDWNRQGLVQGHSDIGLGPEGKREVAGWRVPDDLNGHDWIASPLSRAMETAQILIGRPPEIDPRLSEMSWGEWEGRTLGELRSELGDLMAAWEARGLDFRGPGGESPREVQDRVKPFLAERSEAGRPTVAVCHRGVVRAVYALATGWNMVDKPETKLRDNCVHYFRLEAGGRPVIERLKRRLGALRNVPAVLFHVQHLLGIGHVKRAATLARAMSARGIEVTLVSGGEHVPVLDDSGMRFIQLPPVKASDRTFGSIVDAEGREIGSEIRTERRDMLISLLNEIRPDVLLLELYPFGRRQLRSELTPLIEAAREMSPRPRIVSSVRDILVEKNRPERDREMVDTAKRFFDAVLVHGDPALIPFDRTFPLAGEISDLLHYTGYVVEHRKIENAKGEQGTGEVIVSSGSGAVGELLLRTAVEARPHTSYSDVPWRLLAGYSLPDGIFEDIAGGAPDGVVVERAREDFVTLLKNCRLSISQGGYNTIMEVLACGARGIAVPYAGGHETEQTLRARLLEERGLIQQMPEGELTVEKLVATIERAESLDPPGPDSIDTGGADETARLVEHLIPAAGAGNDNGNIGA